MENRFEELVRCALFTSSDEARLARFQPKVEAELPRVAREVCEILRGVDEGYLRAGIEPFVDVLKGWFSRIFSGVYDAAYFASAAKLGSLQVSLGLAQHHATMTMALVRAALIALVRAAGDDAARSTEDALSRLLAVDLAIVLDAHAREREESRRLESLGNLAAGLAHELRNPLNGARLHIAYLDRALPDAPPDIREAITTARDQIQRLAQRVTEFLAYAQPQPVAAEAMSVDRLVASALDTVRAHPRSAHAQVRAELPPGELLVLGDPTRLGPMLVNLVTNALEALRPSGGTVVVRACREREHVRIEIEDDGVGLDPGMPIHDPFFSTKLEGARRGLALVHRVVTDHRGTIYVATTAGRTIFEVRIPSART